MQPFPYNRSATQFFLTFDLAEAAVPWHDDVRRVFFYKTIMRTAERVLYDFEI